MEFLLCVLLSDRKSGVYAAHKGHQTNTISVSPDWTRKKGYNRIPHIIKYEKNNLKLTPINVKVFDWSSLAVQFIKSISIS
jgi:hypothetical protein